MAALKEPVTLDATVVRQWEAAIERNERRTHIQAIKSGFGFRAYYQDMGYEGEDLERTAEEAYYDHRDFRADVSRAAEAYVKEWARVFLDNYPTHSRPEDAGWMPEFVWPYNGYGSGNFEEELQGGFGNRVAISDAFRREFRGTRTAMLIRDHEGSMHKREDRNSPSTTWMLGGLQWAFNELRQLERRRGCTLWFNSRHGCTRCRDTNAQRCTHGPAAAAQLPTPAPTQTQEIIARINQHPDPSKHIRRRMAIIGFCGYAGSGKDTAAAVCVATSLFRRRAFANKLKNLLGHLNPFYQEIQETHLRLLARMEWEDMKRKYPCVRRELVRTGEAHRKLFGEDFWVDACLPPDESYEGQYIAVSDVRYPNEVARIKSLGGEVWYIDRPDCVAANETELESITECRPLCKLVLDNSGSQAYFTQMVENLVMQMLRGS